MKTSAAVLAFPASAVLAHIVLLSPHTFRSPKSYIHRHHSLPSLQPRSPHRGPSTTVCITSPWLATGDRQLDTSFESLGLSSGTLCTSHSAEAMLGALVLEQIIQPLNGDRLVHYQDLACSQHGRHHGTSDIHWGTPFYPLTLRIHGRYRFA